MKIVFNGLVQHSTSGCVPCGHKRTSNYSYVTSRMYILPSGRTITFYQGKVEDVSDQDGAFLLQNGYTDKNGEYHNAFTRID